MADVIDITIEPQPEIVLRLLEPPAQLPADMAAVIVGPIGPPGPAGGGAWPTYTHTQALPAAVWTVAHNLGRWPSITVTDHLGRRIEPDVAYLDDDLVQVTHGIPLTGFAYCN